MFIVFHILFHWICSIGRFFRKLFQLIVGRRHESSELPMNKTEPVTLEHIRIISEMENDSNRPYPTSSSFSPDPKMTQAEWNSWGANDIFRQKRLSSHSTTGDKDDEQIDYFSSIAAQVKKTPKIILKKRLNDNENLSNTHHNRLQMTNDDESIEFKPGLDEWHEEGNHSSAIDSGTWDESADLDGLSQEAAEALRESRRIDREKKLREHQQRKINKESSRPLTHKRESLSLSSSETIR